MTPFNALMLAIYSVVMTAFATFLGLQAELWISTGYGLNPLFSLPLATLDIVSILFVWQWLCSKAERHFHPKVGFDPTTL